MQKSTIAFLLISFFLASCATNSVLQGYTKKVSDTKIFDVFYFSNPKTDYVYKANIRVCGDEFSGILIAKKLNDSTHRVVFTTEFGNKLMDFEISQDDFKVNSIVSELDRKMLLNTLKTDFGLLFKGRYLIQDEFENVQNIVFKSDAGNRYNYLFISKSEGKLLKIVRTSARKEKINLSFTSANNFFAERIVIQHTNIPLRIELNYLK